MPLSEIRVHCFAFTLYISGIQPKAALRPRCTRRDESAEPQALDLFFVTVTLMYLSFNSMEWQCANRSRYQWRVYVTTRNFPVLSLRKSAANLAALELGPLVDESLQGGPLEGCWTFRLESVRVQVFSMCVSCQ